MSYHVLEWDVTYGINACPNYKSGSRGRRALYQDGGVYGNHQSLRFRQDRISYATLHYLEKEECNGL